MRILAIDPGATCGWALINRYHFAARSGTCPLEGLPNLLHDTLASCLVCEDFVIRPQQVRTQDPRVPAAVGIGMVRYHSIIHNISLHMVQPSVKSAGEAWGLKLQERYVHRARIEAVSEHERDALDLAAYIMRELELGKVT